MRVVGLVLIVWIFSSLGKLNAQRVHAHNDYNHDFPFWEAYTAGALSIEADVFVKGKELYVAHNKEDIDSTKTLRKLYLEPLTKVLNSNSLSEFVLLIDFKTEAYETLDVLVQQLQDYNELKSSNKLRLVISGSRPEIGDYDKYPSFIYFDHQSISEWPDGKDKVAMVSLPFYKYCLWNGKVKLEEKCHRRLQEVINEAHDKGYEIRFWATPDTELAWETLHKIGVDYINTDTPYKCVNFFKK